MKTAFGCQADRTYTFFDQCLFDAMPNSTTWRELFDATRVCVRKLERELNTGASDPQGYFGKAVKGLPMHF